MMYFMYTGLMYGICNDNSLDYYYYSNYNHYHCVIHVDARLKPLFYILKIKNKPLFEWHAYGVELQTLQNTISVICFARTQVGTNSVCDSRRR